MKKTLTFFAFSTGLLLSSCGNINLSRTLTTLPSDLMGRKANPDTIDPQGVAAPTPLNAGQTKTLIVRVNGASPTIGQLQWTTSNKNVVAVTQSGLVTALAPGSVTVRATLVRNSAVYIEFPITVRSDLRADTPPTYFAQRVLELVNDARATTQTCGTSPYAAVAPVTYSDLLHQSAEAHAADMAGKNYFNHTSQDGRRFEQRISATGYAWRTVGENIAAGQVTPEMVVNGWLASPGHCANIMNPDFKELGVGYAYNAMSTYKHYWVQDFGAR